MIPAILAAKQIGTIFNATVKDRALTMDAWLDPAKTPPNLLRRLRAGDTIDVSIGAYVDMVPTVGVHNGKPYRHTWTRLDADHLAFLPNSKGACGTDIGCGARAAEDEEAADSQLRIPPDPYAPYLPRVAASSMIAADAALADMATVRDSYYLAAAQATIGLRQPAKSDVYANPPDGYALALAARSHR